jgi:hypothetical protein
MELYGSILAALGSIASLISLVSVWKGHEQKLLRFSFILIFVLTTSSAFFSYKYYESTKPEVVRAARHAELKSAARLFLSNKPLNPSYFEPGENEGIIKSGLILLELYKDLYPETYARIKTDIESDLKYAQSHRNKSEQRESLDSAAKAILKVISILSGNG